MLFIFHLLWFFFFFSLSTCGKLQQEQKYYNSLKNILFEPHPIRYNKNINTPEAVNLESFLVNNMLLWWFSDSRYHYLLRENDSINLDLMCFPKRKRTKLSLWLSQDVVFLWQASLNLHLVKTLWYYSYWLKGT